jgi:hypothetical protein
MRLFKNKEQLKLLQDRLDVHEKVLNECLEIFKKYDTVFREISNIIKEEREYNHKENKYILNTIKTIMVMGKESLNLTSDLNKEISIIYETIDEKTKSKKVIEEKIKSNFNFSKAINSLLELLRKTF